MAKGDGRPEKPKGKERDQSIKAIAYHLKQLKSSDGKPIEERGDHCHPNRHGDSHV